MDPVLFVVFCGVHAHVHVHTRHKQHKRIRIENIKLIAQTILIFPLEIDPVQE